VRGVFVAFEGIDGSGKSTHARRVAAAANALFTFEPGDTALGASLRTALLDADTEMSPATEALLMLADRAHHVHCVIEPALVGGRSVVSDRYAASTLAYQGFGRGVDLETLRAATALATGDLSPDVTVLLDVPVSVARQRGAAQRGDRFESAGDEFLERVRQGFLTLAREGGARWHVVNGARSAQDVARDVDRICSAVGLRRA